jgi:hypothetical protein
LRWVGGWVGVCGGGGGEPGGRTSRSTDPAAIACGFNFVQKHAAADFTDGCAAACCWPRPFSLPQSNNGDSHYQSPSPSPSLRWPLPSVDTPLIPSACPCLPPPGV